MRRHVGTAVDDGCEARALLDLDRMHRELTWSVLVLVGAYSLRQVLEEVTAARDVQQLCAPADCQRRHVVLERRPQQRHLARVAALLRRVRLGMGLCAIPRRINVCAAREHHPVQR